MPICSLVHLSTYVTVSRIYRDTDMNECHGCLCLLNGSCGQDTCRVFASFSILGIRAERFYEMNGGQLASNSDLANLLIPLKTVRLLCRRLKERKEGDKWVEIVHTVKCKWSTVSKAGAVEKIVDPSSCLGDPRSSYTLLCSECH